MLPVRGFQKSFYPFRAPPEAFAREKGLLVIAAQTKPTEAFGGGEDGGKGWVCSMGLELLATKGLLFHYKN